MAKSTPLPSDLVLSYHWYRNYRNKVASIMHSADLTPKLGKTTRWNITGKEIQREWMKLMHPMSHAQSCCHQHGWLLPPSSHSHHRAPAPAFVLFWCSGSCARSQHQSDKKQPGKEKWIGNSEKKSETRPFLLMALSCKNGLFHESDA